jgi:circadian clock protein KaiB
MPDANQLNPARDGTPPIGVDAGSAHEKLVRAAAQQAGSEVVFRLFVSGATPTSSRAISNIRSLCEKYLLGKYSLEVIDLYQNPKAAKEEHIIAAPTLVMKCPKPVRMVLGNLEDTEKVLKYLDLKGEAL